MVAANVRPIGEAERRHDTDSRGGEAGVLRCLHVVSGDLWGGAEAATYQLLLELARRPGVGLRVIALNEARLTRRLRAAGVPCDVLPESRLGPARLLRRMVAIVRSWRPDVIHSHRYKENVLAAFAAASAGAAHLRTFHGLPPVLAASAGRLGRICSALDMALVRLLRSTCITVSEDLGARLEAYRPDLRVVPNGLPRDVPPGGREALEELTGAARSHLIVGYAGRLEPVKRPDRFVRVASRLPPLLGGRPVRFVMLGDGSLRERVRDQIESMGLEGRCLLAGEFEEAERLISGLDLLLLTSDHEGTPMALLEAMRAGTAVVATNVGGVPEVLGSGRWMSDPQDEEDLASKVRAILADERLRGEWSDRLRERFALRYEIGRVTDAVLEIYRGRIRPGAGR